MFSFIIQNTVFDGANSELVMQAQRGRVCISVSELVTAAFI